MKQWLLLFFVTALGGCEVVSNSTPLPSPSPLSPRSSTSVLGLSINEDMLKTFTDNNVSYRATWSIISDNSLVTVGVNNQLSSSSSQIYARENCTTLTSGGFYGKDNLPIGMVVSQGEEIYPWQENQLFNGLLGWNGSTLSIQKEVSSGNSWAIQAGPVLYLNSQPVRLELKNDQRARRIIAGVTSDNKLLVIAIVAEDSLFEGPLLADMPLITQKLEEVIGVKIVSALNLDGGTASAFVSQNVTLKELKSIGSWICVR